MRWKNERNAPGIVEGLTEQDGISKLRKRQIGRLLCFAATKLAFLLRNSVAKIGLNVPRPTQQA